MILDEKKQDLDFVYNAEETDVNWKALPNRTLASRRENTSTVGKDRVSEMVYVDAKGTQRMPSNGISKTPRCFKMLKSA